MDTDLVLSVSLSICQLTSSHGDVLYFANSELPTLWEAEPFFVTKEYE